MAQQGYGRDEWLTTSRGGEDEHEHERRDSRRAPYYESSEERRGYSFGNGSFARDNDRSREAIESWRGSRDRYADSAWGGEISRRREPESYGSEGGSSRGSWGYRGRDYGELDEGRYSSAPGTARSSFDDDFRERARESDRHDDRYRDARRYDDDRGDRSRGMYDSAAFEPRREYPDSRDRFREDDRNRFTDDDWRWRDRVEHRGRAQDIDRPAEAGRRSRYDDESGPPWDHDRSRSRR